jgi:hypothetical protein
MTGANSCRELQFAEELDRRSAQSVHAECGEMDEFTAGLKALVVAASSGDLRASRRELPPGWVALSW